MRRLLTALLLLYPAGLAAAQVHVYVHDDQIDFASRGTGVPLANDGWAFTRYAFDHNGGGIGHRGILGWSTIMQDQNCSTPEALQFALFDQLTFDGSNPPNPIPPGDVRSVPDVNAVLAQTPVFLSPGCQGGTPNAPTAWVWDVILTTPIPGGRIHDIFVGTYLAACPNPLGLDGSFSPVSVQNQGPNQEYPSKTLDPASREEIDKEYGFTMLGGSLSAGGPIQGTEMYSSSSPRIWVNTLMYEHYVRAGALDTTGSLFLSIPATGPANYGWAGDYPDAANLSGTGGALPPRADDLIYLAEHETVGGPSVQGMILLSTTLARSTFGAPISLGADSWLELDPLDPLFHFTISGLLPGLSILGVPPGPQVYQLAPAFGIQSLGVASDLHQFGVNFYAQELRFDLATLSIELSSLDTTHWRN